MNKFQLLFVPLFAATAIWMAFRTVRRRTPLRQGVLWVAVWAIGGVLIAVPNSSFIVARFVGIGRGSDLVFYLAICAGLAASLYFYNRFRSLETRITELVRRDAIRHPELGADAVSSAVAEPRER